MIRGVEVKGENKKSTFSKNLKLFTVVQGLNFLTMNMGNIFVSLFLMNISSNAMNALLYNLFISITILLAFFILAPICKSVDKKIGLIIGNGLNCILYLLVTFLGQKVGDYVLILGAISGLGQGFFWVSTNTLVVDLTDYDNRQKYNSISGIISSISGMVGPVFASLIVAFFGGTRGYMVLFSIIFIIMIVSVSLALFVKTEKNLAKFSIRDTYKSVNMKKFKNLQKITWKFNFRDGVIGFLFSILIFEVTKSEVVYGNATVVMTLISIIIYSIIARVKLKVKNISYLGTVLQIIAMLIMTCYFKNMYMIIIYLIVYGVAAPLTNISYAMIAQNVINSIDESGEYRFELNCIKEVWVGVGRITAIAILVGLYYITKDFSLLWIYGLLVVVVNIICINNISKMRRI